MTAMKNLDATDKKIICALQEEFPLVAEPYKLLAEKVGISEEEFLNRVQNLQAEKKIRRMGAVLRHREVGFSSNALCAWEVPAADLESIAAVMSACPAVSHCYDRQTAENWNYNLYTMIHAHSRDEIERIIAELSNQTGIKNFTILFSKREWKKTSMKYFVS